FRYDSGMRNPRFFLTGTLATAGLLALSACGDVPRSDDSPESNTQRAQAIVETFANSYNEAGLSDAVEQTFCPGDADGWSGRQSLDDSAYSAGSMTVSTPASVEGHRGQAGVQVTPAERSAQHYELSLRKDKTQGWCISGVTPAAGGSGGLKDQ
ncbi:hypothetical protein GOHSU_68_00010, partial [Gordonia hirsuta DSM 44140 = NBRC 16056]